MTTSLKTFAAKNRKTGKKVTFEQHYNNDRNNQVFTYLNKETGKFLTSEQFHTKFKG